MSKKLVLCDCMGSQTLDPKVISEASGLPCSKIYTSLCMDQLQDAAKQIAAGEVIVACQQERARFEELAVEIDAPTPGFVDLRDRAGWGEGDQAPKMAALAAEAALTADYGKSVDVISEGTCLIIGGPVALQAASDLSDVLAVTVLLDAETEIPYDRAFDCVKGTVRQVQGALGGFEVRINGFQQMIPGGRQMGWTAPVDGAVSECDIVLDLSGGTAFVQAPEKREGYLRADPAYTPAVATAVRHASQLVGTFEKPLYVRLEDHLCAHSRAQKPACSRCLNLCPTGAITSAGEHVTIDPMICAGCGSCAAVCPSGAISYDAPSVDTVFRRLSTLAATYRSAGGKDAPRLLVHDETHGNEMISLAARFGRGLPADVIPFEVSALAGFGHAEMLAALACGFAEVAILLSPKTERDALDTEIPLARAIAGKDCIQVIDVADPDALSELLYDAKAPHNAQIEPILPIGTRRQVTRLAAKTLNSDQDMVALPEGAPYGAVLVDTESCTLCLSCVSLCPSGALGDNDDKPQLRFQEDACLQCGLCANICPEKAIALQPRLNLSEAALSQTVLHEEEPFECIECGAAFGVKSTVERITEKLAGTHSMFQSSDAARLIQMCDNCRIQAQFHSTDNPFQGAERPAVRTSEDYFSKRRDH
ncbi:MAG: 4Fe-4S binding protein [Pseudomonadota bacterium]